MKNINIHKESKKNFLSKSEINLFMMEIYRKMNKFCNLEKQNKIKNFSFQKNRKKFDKLYFIMKKNKNWKKFYNSLKYLDFYKKNILPKIKKYIRKNYKRNCKIVNTQVRIIEKNDKRNYPIHQELMNKKSRLITFWIAMHDIKKKEGGLMISKEIPTKELKHLTSKMGYPYLENQKKWYKKSREKVFKVGEACILGQHIPHGTAAKFKNNPRWAIIIRASI